MAIENLQARPSHMSHYTSLFDKIVLYDPAKSRSACHSFISHQSPAEEKSLGKLLLIAEIESRDGVNLDIINAIQDELKRQYFNTDDLNIETAFEKALESVNQKIADMVGDYDTNWLDRLNACAAVVKNDVIHFSFVGHVNAFLFRHDKITNIIDSTAAESLTEKINPLKAFSSVISGNLSPNDVVVFCTTSLLDFFSQEKLRRTVTEKNPHEAVHTLDTILSEGTGQTSFAAVIMKIALSQDPITATRPTTISNAPTAPVVAPYAPQASMADLLQKQENTNQVLAPSLSRYVMELLHNAWYKLSYFMRITVFRQSPRRARMMRDTRDHQTIRQQPVETSQTTGAYLSGAAKKTNRLGESTQRVIATIVNVFKRRSPTTSPAQTSREHLTLAQRGTRSILWFKRLPVLSKILLVGVVVVAFFLAQGIFTNVQNKQDAQQSVEYDQNVATINDDITRAEASLSYGNESGAKDLLAQATDLINQLPDRTKEQKATIEGLKASVAAQMEKTKHIVAISSPTVLTDLASTDSSITPKDLAIAGASVYATDPSGKKIYGVSTADGTVGSWPRDASTTFQYLAGVSANALLYVDTANGAGEFSAATKKYTELSFTPAAETNMIGIAIYESRLYFVDINGNQVYRSARSGGTLGTPTAWIKDGTSVSNSVSLAVDGNIYILYKDGAAKKFALGTLQDWSLDTIEPALTKADKIWTDPNTTNLYVMDVTGRRIIEFAKDDGRLLNQYTSDAFSSLKDFAVDPTGKKLYVLNGTTIFTVSI